MITQKQFYIASIGTGVVLSVVSLVWPVFTWLFIPACLLLLLGIYDLHQRRHTLLRLYPIVGHLRYLFESIRPEIQQYFVESNINGRPVSREFRDLIYQRSKGQRDTRPFGTQFDVYETGYEWVNHSLSPQPIATHNPRVRFGTEACLQPYDASPLNISAMSFGSLSRHAILALNGGAQQGGFAHNTGEGGVSPYHLSPGGDLIWQLGTGYFGCRTAEGDFDPELFAQTASLPNVKMIEIKLSQGAKPGHGGILPAAKVTPEIAEIRHVPLGVDVVSPAAHTAFSSPRGLLEFVQDLRNLSGGKPVGFKLCIGQPAEFFAICKAMQETGILPDFITVDGSEGGTGAAPIELTNSVGMPLREGLHLVHSALQGIGVRQQIRVIASGKVFSAFHLFRLLALGADTVNAARAMMFALGCIQSRQCNSDKCPTGIATQNPIRFEALDVEDKQQRVARYQQAMVHNLMELVAAAGLENLDEIGPEHVNRRVSESDIRNYAQIYPQVSHGGFLSGDIPTVWENAWERAESHCW